MGVLRKIREKVELACTERGLGNLLTAFILGTLFTNLSLVIHELGHVLTANLLGCPAGISFLNLYTGASSIGACPDEKMVLVALAGPMFAFLYALYAWFVEGKDSIIRLAGLVSIFYSVLPNLYPAMPGSDAWIAVNQFGLSPVHAWLIWIVTSAIAFYLIAQEITEKEYPFET